MGMGMGMPCHARLTAIQTLQLPVIIMMHSPTLIQEYVENEFAYVDRQPLSRS